MHASKCPPAHSERKNLGKPARRCRFNTCNWSTMFPLDGIRRILCLSEPCTCAEPSLCMSRRGAISRTWPCQIQSGTNAAPCSLYCTLLRSRVHKSNKLTAQRSSVFTGVTNRCSIQSTSWEMNSKPHLPGAFERTRTGFINCSMQSMRWNKSSKAITQLPHSMSSRKRVH